MLRAKSLSILTVSSIIVFILIFVNLKNSVEKDYKYIEVGISKSTHKLINNEFLSSYSNLKRLNVDWSKWDDTYEFIITKDPKIKKHYVESNLTDVLLKDLDLSVIIFLDDKGNIVYQNSYNKNSKIIPLKEITKLKDEMRHHNKETGILARKNNDILIFSNLEIIDSNRLKKPVGNLIMGYFLDENKIKSLENKLGLSFDSVEVSDISEHSEGPYKIKIEKDIVLNKFYIPTVSDQSIALTNHRDANILFLGKENIKKYIVMLLINFFILIFVTYIFMERFIVKRLRNMDRSVKEIIKHKDLGKRLNIKGKDEIGNLGENINNLLEDIEKMKKRLYSLATYDVMTGILNRHSGLEKLYNNFKKFKTNKGSLIIVFIDINNLKYVNDKFSHEEGDKLIKSVVKIIEKNLKDNDLFFRFGGDEFILGFDKSDISEVKNLFENIENQFEEHSKSNSKQYTTSISYGIIECSKEHSLEHSINLADIEMYKDKKNKKKLPERIYIKV